MELACEAARLATKAVDYDKGCYTAAAAYYYNEAAKLLQDAAEAVDEKREEWIKKSSEYRARATTLLKPKSQTELQKPHKLVLTKSRFLFGQAVEAEELNEIEEAIRLYTEAVELAFNGRKMIENEKFQEKFNYIINKALERAEELKGIKQPFIDETIKKEQEPDILHNTSKRPVAPQHATFVRSDSSKHLLVSGKVTYTKEEKEVLFATSTVNKHSFVPFMEIDLKERFRYAIPFTDKDGPLTLSPKQSQQFHKWVRPEEIFSEPILIANKYIDCFSIKQTIVSDCSFVASLAVSALYEKKFGKRLLTRIIYPRKSGTKEPIYNPFGKYMVKLHLNGIQRKIIIDDTLPVDKYNDLLCSFSTKKNEILVSLLEKAYMKVMGGYDFPGSNSSIDLHALTGWIPERCSLRDEPEAKINALFRVLMSSMAKGNVLATVATGELPESVAERAGLIPTHAYAILDVKHVQGVKLMMLKNPWSHVRWRGNYSDLDVTNWTKPLAEELHYNPESASNFDNGVFWIDYASVLKFFDIIYLSWNPDIFKYTFSTHQCWSAGIGPTKDTYNIGDNPQFKLSVDRSGSTVWILLTRHITDIEDFKYNKEYITVYVYATNGRRVYYPRDPSPLIEGVKINSPHYLTKIKFNETPEKDFTLVVGQYEKTTTIYYTLRAYSDSPFELTKIGNPYNYVKKITDGQWKGISAGGCRNHPTFINNPAYQLVLDSAGILLIDLKAPKDVYIGFEIIPIDASDFKKRDTGSFRSSFAVLELDNVPAGTYEIVPSTFEPNTEARYFLTIKASSTMQVTKIR
ncbi:calpain-7-like isoform X1 [Rhodnius prolixus]